VFYGQLFKDIWQPDEVIYEHQRLPDLQIAVSDFNFEVDRLLRMR
jgi:hypothetical protein